MGAKPSTSNGGPQGPRTYSTGNSSEMAAANHGGAFSLLRSIPAIGVDVGNSDSRQRARSLSSVPDLQSSHHHHDDVIVAGEAQQQLEGVESLDGSLMADEVNGDSLGRVYAAHSLPSHIWSLNGIKCPVCSKFIVPDDIECHLVMCLTKPRLSYNEDVLTEDKGECVICLEDLAPGDVIARLPCLCVYHKRCIDRWFDVNRSCPEHPGD